MNYLIDTYNLIHAASAMGGPLADMSVRKLCRYLEAAKRSATLVLDGRSKPEEPAPADFPSLNFQYSGTGVTADTVIGQIVEISPNRRKITVVTNDRAVALYARSHFANAMSCEQFLQELTASGPVPQDDPPQKALGTATTGESDHWMREFGLAGDPNPQSLRPHAEEIRPDDLDIEGLLGPRD
jgi:predicted RNA-binding protein with PIN domain